LARLERGIVHHLPRDRTRYRALVNPLVPILKSAEESEEIEAAKGKPVALDDDEALVTH